MTSTVSQSTPILSDKSTGLKSLRLLACVYLGALVFAALLSPWVYHAIHAWDAARPSWLTEELARENFPPFFDRLRWVWVLITLPWLISSLHIANRVEAGLYFDREAWGSLVRYFFVGIGLVIFAASARILAGEASFHNPQTSFIRSVKAALIAGLVIAILEESVFRILIWRAFALWRPILGGIILASAFFAYTHYKVPDHVAFATGDAVHWYHGWEVAGWILVGVAEAEVIDFLNLFLLGVLLTILRIRSGNIGASFGLHAGLVFALMLFKEWIQVHNLDNVMLWGSPGLRNGLLTTMALAAFILSTIRPMILREESRFK